MTASQTSPDQPFRLEGVQKEQRSIPLSRLFVQADVYSFREEGDLSETGLGDLMEDVKTQRGIHTPLLVVALPDGRYLVIDGHRRFTVMSLLSRDGVEGFAQNIQVPCIVVGPEVSERNRLMMLASSNTQRKSLDADGRQRLAYRLHVEGVPIEQIAQVLAVSKSTVDRDITLGADERMMEHVRLNHLPATDAAKLVKLARDKGRYDEFLLVFEDQVAQVQERLEDEVLQAAERDEISLHPVECWPGRQITREQIDAWSESLSTGIPFMEASFRYRATLKNDKGRKRVVVDPLDVDVDELTAADMAKVYRRLIDLSAALEPELIQKAQSVQQQRTAGDSETSESPGLRRLQELHLDHLAGGATDPEANAMTDGGDASITTPLPAVLDQHFGRSGDPT